MRRRRQESETLAEVWDGLRSDYGMAKTSRFRRTRSGVLSSGSGADYHYRSESDYLRMMELARDFDRNDSIVGQLVDRAVTNILQDGFQPDPQTGDESLNTDLKARWTEWADDPDQCDSQQERTFWEIENDALRAGFVDGDHFLLPNRDGFLQACEAHRCRTPTRAKTKRADGTSLVHGVLLDRWRRRRQYWFTTEDIDPSRAVTRVGEITQYPARDAEGNRNVYQVVANTMKRVSQTRGVTAFAPIVDLLSYVEDINFARLVQAQLVACFAVFRERDYRYSGPEDSQTRGEETTETLEDGSIRTIEGTVPGLEVLGAPGEKLQGFSPNVPNPEFFPHMRFLLTLIGINLGMPLVLVLIDASETNFSGWRGAIDQARLGFRRIQRRLKNRLHVPTYRWKVRQWGADDPAIARAGMRSGINLYRCRWSLPSWPYVDPLKDCMADMAAARNVVTSRRRIAARRGEDWEEIVLEACEDNARLIAAAHERAEELNRKYAGLGLTWRDIACPPTPDGVKLTLTPETEDADRAKRN